ncbi:MAG: ribosome maturation factor RimM [Tannerellaceae bacterium]|jgi:16S rRNA processing protein RimM|nr:ribosome maturation factor RimM [Tannerellaceae bacterium]
MIRKEDTRPVGRFTKPHGIKGELGLAIACDLFQGEDYPVLICEMEGILVPFFVEAYRSKSSSVLLIKLENVDSEEVARRFTNRQVYVLRQASDDDDDPPSPEGWNAYKGYTVSDRTQGLLGRITAIDETTANTLLQISDPRGREILLPGVREWILEANHETKHLEVVIPSGLSCINDSFTG